GTHGGAIGLKPVIELLQALFQRSKDPPFLREFLLESFHFGIHRRQLFQRADLVRIAQPRTPFSCRGYPENPDRSDRRRGGGPTVVGTRTGPVMGRGLGPIERGARRREFPGRPRGSAGRGDGDTPRVRPWYLPLRRVTEKKLTERGAGGKRHVPCRGARPT